MQLGLIGLGKMGGNMRERIRRAGHEVIGYDRDPEVSDVASVQEMIDGLQAPRTVWVMVPAGEITRSVIADLADRLDEGDLVIDGGNSRFTDDFEHAEVLGEQVFEFFLRAKWDEWHDYTAQITPWEIDTGIDL